MTAHLKKLLDSTPKSVYNIFKDGGGFDLSPITKVTTLEYTLYANYKLVRDTYEANPDLFVSPPVFAGGFFRDILWETYWSAALDLFVNSHGLSSEEAEDNLCLVLHKMGLNYTEHNPQDYAGLGPEGTFRVFNCALFDGNVRCHMQVILKDLGPPEDDPLYVTKNFHYNHAKAALSVVGDPEIHYHGHAVAGKEHKIHAQYREGGFDKCDGKYYPSREFRRVDFRTAENVLSERPKSGVKMPNPRAEGTPIRSTGAQYFQVREWRNELVNELHWQPVAPPEPAVNPLEEIVHLGRNILEAQRAAIQQRNEFVNQFDPLRNNRRPVP